MSYDSQLFHKIFKANRKRNIKRNLKVNAVGTKMNYAKHQNATFDKNLVKRSRSIKKQDTNGNYMSDYKIGSNQAMNQYISQHVSEQFQLNLNVSKFYKTKSSAFSPKNGDHKAKNVT